MNNMKKINYLKLYLTGCSLPVRQEKGYLWLIRKWGITQTYPEVHPKYPFNNTGINQDISTLLRDAHLNLT